jgi:hypothetical protein
MTHKLALAFAQAGFAIARSTCSIVAVAGANGPM